MWLAKTQHQRQYHRCDKQDLRGPVIMAWMQRAFVRRFGIDGRRERPDEVNKPSHVVFHSSQRIRAPTATKVARKMQWDWRCCGQTRTHQGAGFGKRTGGSCTWPRQACCRGRRRKVYAQRVCWRVRSTTCWDYLGLAVGSATAQLGLGRWHHPSRFTSNIATGARSESPIGKSFRFGGACLAAGAPAESAQESSDVIPSTE